MQHIVSSPSCNFTSEGTTKKVAIQHVKFVNVHTLRVDYAVEVPVDYEGSEYKTLKRSTNVAIFGDKFYLVR